MPSVLLHQQSKAEMYLTYYNAGKAANLNEAMIKTVVTLKDQ